MDQEALREFLEIDLGVDVDDIDSDTLLFSTGIIDSFALVNIMMFLEKKAGIKVDPSDVNLENFDTIGRMLAYVEAKKNA